MHISEVLKILRGKQIPPFDGNIVSECFLDSDKFASAITIALMERKYSPDLKLDLSFHCCSQEDFGAIAYALEIGAFPPNSRIRFIGRIGVEDAKVIANALASDKCPSNLQIAFHCDVDDGVVEVIANVLEKCPRGLRIGFGVNHISDAGAKVIANVLAKCPPDLTIDFGFNDIGDAGIKALDEALNSEDRPWGLRIRNNGHIKEAMPFGWETDDDEQPDFWRQVREQQEQEGARWQREATHKSALRAFTSGMHPRLGENSPVQGLPLYLCHAIGFFTRGQSWRDKACQMIGVAQEQSDDPNVAQEQSGDHEPDMSH